MRKDFCGLPAIQEKARPTSRTVTAGHGRCTGVPSGRRVGGWAQYAFFATEVTLRIPVPQNGTFFFLFFFPPVFFFLLVTFLLVVFFFFFFFFDFFVFFFFFFFLFFLF